MTDIERENNETNEGNYINDISYIKSLELELNLHVAPKPSPGRDGMINFENNIRKNEHGDKYDYSNQAFLKHEQKHRDSPKMVGNSI